jgi:SAM-dependent methyltransferase
MDKKRMQDEVRSFWNAEPCDSENSNLSPEDRDYYEEIQADRYLYQAHILDVLDWVDWGGRRILEIGTGVGTDARQLISRGAVYTGINVDQGSVNATARALRVFGLPGEVRRCSATDLQQFQDHGFDVVYSFGVLHHIPDVDFAVKEIHRVLKPGGSLLIMLYNRDSINYKIEIRLLRKLALRMLALPGAVYLFSLLGLPREKLEKHAELYRKFGGLSDDEWLSRNTDGPENPYSLVYDASEVYALLKGFDVKRMEVDFFDFRHWGYVGRILPRILVRWLGRRWGWHRIVLAIKNDRTTEDSDRIR